jgi:hypothetical protein
MLSQQTGAAIHTVCRGLATTYALLDVATATAAAAAAGNRTVQNVPPGGPIPRGCLIEESTFRQGLPIKVSLTVLLLLLLLPPCCCCCHPAAVAAAAAAAAA